MNVLTVQLVILVAKLERHLSKYLVKKKSVHFGQHGLSIVIAVLLVAMVLRREHVNVLTVPLVKKVAKLEKQLSKNCAEKKNAYIGQRSLITGCKNWFWKSKEGSYYYRAWQYY